MHSDQAKPTKPQFASYEVDLTILRSSSAYVEYANALRDLTSNSKPIINGLTILAHENAMSSNAFPVSVAIIDHFLQVIVFPNY